MKKSFTTQSSQRKFIKQEQTSQGGRVAISGFYFQFWAIFAAEVDHIRLHSFNDPANALFGYEYKDEDGVIVHGREARIIQVKHSEKEEVIGPQEANDIFDSMTTFAEKEFPKADGWTHKFELMTNRPKSSHTEKIHSGQNCASAGKYPQLAGFLRDCAWTQVTFEQCHATIEHWGREFGMTGSYYHGEISDGVSNVWRRFTEDVIPKKHWMTQNELEQAFTGYPEPYRVCLDFWDEYDNPSKKVAADAERFCHDANAILSCSAIKRTALLAEIQSKLLNTNIVIICGNGGNGKSALLGQIVSEKAQRTFTAGKIARELRDYWPSYCVSRWRNQPIEGSRRYEDVDQALERMRLATPAMQGSRKIVFAVDGLDEADLDQSAISKLIADFRLLPVNLRSHAALLVTCRNEDKVDALRPLFDNHAYDNEHRIYEKVEVSEFSAKDILHDIAQNAFLSEEVKDLLHKLFTFIEVRKLPTPGFRGGTRSSTAGEYETLSNTGGQDSLSGYSSLVQPLLHPVVWKFFVSDDISNEQRLDMLHNRAGSWHTLAELMVDWFAHKSQARTHGRLEEMWDDAKATLMDVATKCPKASHNYSWQDWALAGDQSTIMRRVFRHAVTSGFVICDAQKYEPWQWKHEFLPQYLVSARGEKTQK